tara:strand:+ start:232 stop:447 length:216 start_codon:yes stop_codon:yes gene_type:complete
MLIPLDFTVPTKDLFWEEKVKRSIDNSSDLKEVKEIATLLAKVASQRAGVINGLIRALSEAEFSERPSLPS